MVNQWVMDAWKHVATDDHILESFRQFGYFGFDGVIDKLYLKLRDTINNREVLYNFVKNVNAFIYDKFKQMKLVS